MQGARVRDGWWWPVCPLVRIAAAHSSYARAGGGGDTSSACASPLTAIAARELAARRTLAAGYYRTLSNLDLRAVRLLLAVRDHMRSRVARVTAQLRAVAIARSRGLPDPPDAARVSQSASAAAATAALSAAMSPLSARAPGAAAVRVAAIRFDVSDGAFVPVIESEVCVCPRRAWVARCRVRCALHTLVAPATGAAAARVWDRSR